MNLGNVFVAYHIAEMVLYRAALRNITADNVQYTSIRPYAKDALRSLIILLEKLGVKQIRAFWISRKTSQILIPT